MVPGTCYSSMMEYFANSKKHALAYLKDTTHRSGEEIMRDGMYKSHDSQVIKCVTHTHTSTYTHKHQAVMNNIT